MKVLCIGNSSYDITIPVDDYPLENKKIRLEHQVIECGGGSSSNAACLLGLWGANTTIASVVGNDIYGDTIEKEYKKFNVNTKYLQKMNSKTSISYIVDNLNNSSRTIFVNRNKELIIKNIEVLDDYDYILLDGGNIDLSLEVLKNNKAISILDAGNLNDNTLKLSKLVDYIVCSNDFAKEYTGINFNYQEIDKIKTCYDILEKDFPGKIIITLESFGSFVKINDEYKLIPSIEVETIDTTGAGDLYHGAFVFFLSQGYTLEKVMKLSNITGALSTRYIGGRNSIPKLEEVLEYDK